jgi:hypothetical protein
MVLRRLQPFGIIYLLYPKSGNFYLISINGR